MKYYLIGIKGSAMSALAKLLLTMNYKVRGCDLLYDYDFYSELKDKVICDSLNQTIYSKEYFYIIGNAFLNSDIACKIKEEQLSYETYPKFVNNLFNSQKVAISATHGKTTICKIISCIASCELSVLIGDGTSYYNKNAKAFVFEACEYKETFLNYFPNITVINNIDYDHPDYYLTKENYFDAFNKLANQSNFVIYNGDDVNCQNITCTNKLSYGFNKTNDVVCSYDKNGDGYDVVIKYAQKESQFFLPFLGRHMIYNFLAAFCVVKRYGISDELISKRISNFTFPKRRNQITTFKKGVVICDYAHHPAEINALYESVCLKYQTLRKVIVFQGHTYTRSMTFKDEFKNSLKLFDEAYYVDIFSSIREADSPKINEEFFYYLNIRKYDKTVKQDLEKKNNLVICFVGAGNIDEFYKDFLNGKI